MRLTLIPDFLNFDSKFKSQIPSWFLRWWSMHGLIPVINHELVLQEAVQYFSSVNALFPVLLLFSSKNKVPWIFKWQYEVQLSIVTIRQYDLQMATIGLSVAPSLLSIMILTYTIKLYPSDRAPTRKSFFFFFFFVKRKCIK
jgi:hypothetical protein